MNSEYHTHPPIQTLFYKKQPTKKKISFFKAYLCTNGIVNDVIKYDICRQ